MKIFISADIEGVTGVTHWDETSKDKADYSPFARQMTRETAACCRGALAGGATEIFVKDAHSSGRNLIPDDLPREVTLIRGWTGDPDIMIAGLDESFDGIMFVGYHSGSGLDGNPLSHTMTTQPYTIRINGRPAGEFELHALIASGYNVPPLFISSDNLQCLNAADFVENITTVAVKKGVGGATFNMHPDKAVALIEESARSAVENRKSIRFKPEFPVNVDVTFRDHFKAFRMSHFPGATLTDPTTVNYRASDPRELAVFSLFVL